MVRISLSLSLYISGFHPLVRLIACSMFLSPGRFSPKETNVETVVKFAVFVVESAIKLYNDRTSIALPLFS